MRAGTGDEITYSTITYAARSEYEHGKAIRAVLRTGGDMQELTDEEKAYFAQGGVKDAESFLEAVYENYRQALFDEEGNLKRYDYIVVQLYAAELDSDSRKEGLLDCLSGISDENTKILINIPQGKVTAKNVPFHLSDTTYEKEEMLQEILPKLKEALFFQSIDLVFTGRATCNYFLSDGTDRAQLESPEDFAFYEETDSYPVRNDLVVHDNSHPTQLGTYLFACVLYTAVYQKNPADTVPQYHAEVADSILNINNLKPGKNYSLMHGPFLSETVLQRAADLAYRTQTGQLALPLSVPAIKRVVDKGTLIRVSWEAVEGAESYRVFRKTGEEEWEELGETTRLYFKDQTPVRGTIYQYGVSCVFEKGRAISSRYTSNKKKIGFLESPVLKNVKAVKSGVKIYWKEVTGANQYIVYRKTKDSDWKKIGTSKMTSYTDTKAAGGTAYDYTVSSYYNEDAKSPKDETGLHIFYLKALSKPSAAPRKKEFKLTWLQPSERVDGYRIEYSRDSSFPEGSTKSRTIKDPKRISKVIRNLKKKKYYYARIRTFKKVKGTTWYSAWSTKVRVKTK